MARRAGTNRRRSAEVTASSAPNVEDVARRAYELYQARGGEPGADVDDWLQAEQELRAPTPGDGSQTA